MLKLLLVDGHAYAYRAFYAIRKLSAPDGRPTNAIFGFVKMLARMRETVKPTHLAVVWDGGLSAERMELVPEYKAQRAPMPDDLERQIGEIDGYLGAAGVASLQDDGVEADDMIGTLAQGAVQQGMKVVVASADKDFFQLVSADVGVLNPADKSESVWGEAQVKDKTGVMPSQVVDWLSLVGDAVDNIEGVPGVGAKTAAELLRKFGSLDDLYAQLDAVQSNRVRLALQQSAELVRKNQRMVRLKCDLQGVVAPTELTVREPDREKLLELFRRWGFKSLAAEVEAGLGSQPDLFAQGGIGRPEFRQGL